MRPELFPLAGKRVFVAGHRGMVGAALVRRLAREPVDLLTASHAALDLTRQAKVESWMRARRPEVVIVAAAKVGGILANASHPVEFLAQNLLIELNLIRSAFAVGVEKLLFLGSSCIYPRSAPQPIRESDLLSGPLEPTNQWYAVAKIAGVKLCQAYRQQHGCDFISAMPTNLYGPGDNVDLDSSHVVPALLRKLHEAKIARAPAVEVWGTGTPRREFLHVDDLADACLFLLERYADSEHVNVGCGTDITIRELAELARDVVGYRGRLVFDTTKPDGTPRKLLDVTKLAELGWRSGIDLRDGLVTTYSWYRQSLPSIGTRDAVGASDRRGSGRNGNAHCLAGGGTRRGDPGRLLPRPNRDRREPDLHREREARQRKERVGSGPGSKQRD